MSNAAGINGSLCLVLLVASVSQLGAQDDEASPEERYASVVRDYRPASVGFRNAKTDRERRKAIETYSTFSRRFLDVAEAFPDHPIALEALREAIQVINSTDSMALTTWELNTSEVPTGSPEEAAKRATSLILRDHLQSAGLVPLCDRMRYGYRLEYEDCLRTIFEKTPHREVRAIACLSLAQNRNDRLRMLQLAADRPGLAKQWATVFGEDFLPTLRKRGASKLAREAESTFERAVEFEDVQTPMGSTVASSARSGLHEMRHLAVGKTAPEIEGRDQDDRPFKLSDYRGKVVLLYFWSEY